MKKVYLCLWLFLATAFTAVSQDSVSVSSENIFKARAGHVTTELNINPIKGELSLNNALNQIKFRYFTTDNVALRLAFIINSQKHTTDNANPYGTSPTSLEETQKTRTLGLNFGVEQHFKGTGRLSPYVAAEFSVASKSSSHKIKDNNSTTEIDGAWQKIASYAGGYTFYDYEERGFTKLGLNVILGFDFYVAKHLYLGYELGLGINSTKYKDIDIITSYSSSNPPSNSDADITEKEFSFGPSLINGIRLGYAF